MIVVIDGTGPDPAHKPTRIETARELVRGKLAETRVGAYLIGEKLPPPKSYDEEMRGSFCKQIKSVADAIYFRGPTLYGSETSSIADNAVSEVVAGLREDPSEEVILAGYSRGGCAAIIAARRLAHRGIDVDAMFLFDAVDMQGSEMDLSRTITPNVQFVAHARSARNAAFWARNPVKSRFYFYNTGLSLDGGGGDYTSKSFVGSHAALGGLPWVDIKEDPACALAVAGWMSGHLQAHGVAVNLKLIGQSS